MTSCSDLVSSARAYIVTKYGLAKSEAPIFQHGFRPSLVELTGCIASPVSLPLSRLAFMLLLYYIWCTAVGVLVYCATFSMSTSMVHVVVRSE